MEEYNNSGVVGGFLSLNQLDCNLESSSGAERPPSIWPRCWLRLLAFAEPVSRSVEMGPV